MRAESLGTLTWHSKLYSGTFLYFGTLTQTLKNVVHHLLCQLHSVPSSTLVSVVCLTQFPDLHMLFLGSPLSPLHTSSLDDTNLSTHVRLKCPLVASFTKQYWFTELYGKSMVLLGVSRHFSRSCSWSCKPLNVSSNNGFLVPPQKPAHDASYCSMLKAHAITQAPTVRANFSGFFFK